MSSRIEGAASAAPSPPDRLGQLAVEIADEVRLVDQSYSTALQHAIAAGAKLIEAKELVKTDSTKRWLPWVEKNFPDTPRTAQNYMLLAENAKRVSHFRSVREALTSLAKPRKARTKPAPKRESTQPKTLLTPEVIAAIEKRWSRERIAEEFFKSDKGSGLRQAQDAIREYMIRKDERARAAGQAQSSAKRKATEGGKRTRQLHAAKRAGLRDPESDLFKMQVALSEAATLLERFDLPELTWTEEMQERLNEIVYEIERHLDWGTRAFDVVWAHMNDISRQGTIRKLRVRVDDPSSEPWERKNAANLLERFERRYNEQKEIKRAT
jgi:hypothetical protein